MNKPLGKIPALVRKGNLGICELIKEFDKCSIMAEVGCYAGESAKIWLESGMIETLYAIDPWENYYNDGSRASSVCDMKIVEEFFDQRMREYGGVVVKVKRASLIAVNMFPDEFFDIVYIDGNHAAVKADILAWLPKIKIGGIISGHDYRDKYKAEIDIGLGKAPDKIYKDTSWMTRIKGTKK